MQTANEVKTIVQGWTEDQLSNLHTALPAKIVSYKPATNRAKVQPVGEFKTADERSLPYPEINSVPVIFPCGAGGKSGMTFPIKAGDSGLIIFAENQLTDFLTGSGDSEDTRRHSLNDAIFLPGLYSNAVPKSVSNPNDVCIFCDFGYFKLNGSEFSGEVAGTQFSFSGGDLVVNGISLTKHIHGGVIKGGATTSTPQ